MSPLTSAEACSWEWGGVVEAVPTPCVDASIARLGGGLLVGAGLAIVALSVLAAVLVVIALRSGV